MIVGQEEEEEEGQTGRLCGLVHSCSHSADVFLAGWDRSTSNFCCSFILLLAAQQRGSDEERPRTVPAPVFRCAPCRSVDVLNFSLESRPWHGCEH